MDADSLVDLVAAAVTNLPTTGTQVDVEPARPIQQLPNGVDAGVVVMPITDAPTAISASRGESATTKFECTIAVISYARTRALRRTSSLEVRRAIAGLFAEKARFVFSGITYERQAEHEKLYAAVHRVSVTYLESAGGTL